VVAGLIGTGPSKSGRLDRDKLQLRDQRDDVFIRTTQEAQAQQAAAVALPVAAALKQR